MWVHGWPFLDLVFDAPALQGIRTGDGAAEEQLAFLEAGLLAPSSPVLLQRATCIGEGCGLLADS